MPRQRFRQMTIVTLLCWTGVSTPCPAADPLPAPDDNTVRVAGIVLKWRRGNKQANYRRAEPMIREAASNGAQIVCTTECFLDGYAIADKNIPLDTYRALGEPIPDGPYVKRLCNLAEELKITLVAGMLEADGEDRYNTAVLIGPGGMLLGKYRKQHLGHETVRNRPGSDSAVFSTRHGRVGIMICADRRYEDTVRQFRENGARFLLCPSGGMFGSKKNDPILQARSRENRTYIVFVHPAEFLVTAPDGSIVDRTILGKQLLVTDEQLDTDADQRRVFYFDLPITGSAPSVLATPKQRQLQYTQRPRDQAAAWQPQVRAELVKLLKLDNLLNARIPFDAKVLSSEPLAGHDLKELEINSTPGRRIQVVMGLPRAGAAPFPAVVCIHGHGGSRDSPYEPKTIYKAFGTALADRGFVTISTDVGQHEVYEENRTLMGERLWDVMRCVDYVTSLPEVDAARVGCGGLSLGGEMAMWLGAMDDRIATTVSCGFLTVMDQMEQNHCMCWKFPGLRDLVDYADIYSLIAPRPLQCQNGLKEGRNDFYVPIARKAMKEIRLIYTDFGTPENATLHVHEGAHEIDLPALLAFFEEHLTATRK